MTTLDAYVTLAELTTYFSGDDRATAFLSLTDLQKTSYLNRATKAIDSVPVRGTKYDLNITDGAADQARAFPRIIDGEILDYDSATGTALVPPDVKYACMEEALELYRNGTGGRRLLQEQGVQSFSIGGKLSETFIAGAVTTGLQSAKARQYLRRYMGVAIR